MPLLTQRRWRIMGGAALAACLVMAVMGSRIDVRESLRFFTVYWGVFLILLILVMWAVLLDVRFIRREYLSRKRDIFRETLGEEEFRRALLEAQRKPDGSSGEKGRKE